MAAFEVIALDTATPQLRAPGAADTYTFPRAVEMPLGTANGVLYLNGSKVVSSGSGLVFDSSGNLGLGVTPSAWSGVSNVFQIAGNAYIASTTHVLNHTANAFYNGSNWIYTSNNFASQTEQVNGTHIWKTAPSGTAGNAISFTQAMTLNASGNLGIGITAPAYKLHVVGSEMLQGGGGDTIPALSTSLVNGEICGALNPITDYGLLRLSSGGLGGALNTKSAIDLQGYGSTNNSQIRMYTAGTERARIPTAGGMVVGTAALATNATDGFLYVPTCAGTPTGTPTTQTGTAPIVINTTNNKLYFYSGGAWRDAGP